MAVIVLDIPTIPGESTVAGYLEKLDAVSIGGVIDLPTPRKGSRSSARTVGQSRHAPIEIVRYKDRGSPLIASACASGTNLGEVNIYLFRTLEVGLVPYMQYTLTETFVSRLEQETEDDMGAVYGPHISDGGGVPTPLSPRAGSASMQELARQVLRPSVRPANAQSEFSPTSWECERLWLNAATMTWTYTEFINGVASGNTSAGWNIQRGIAL